MKTKTFISIILFFTFCLLNGQNIKPERFKGSWAGNIILPDSSSIFVVMKFAVKDNFIEGNLDVPEQSTKDIYIDSVTGSSRQCDYRPFINYRTRIFF